MEKSSVVNVGGNLESAIQGQYQIDIASVLKEAWQKTQQGRSAINGGLALIFVLAMVASYWVSSYFGGIEQAIKTPQSLLFIQVIVSLIIWPFLAGIEMMGVFHSVGVKTHSKLIFSFLKRSSWVVLCSLLTFVLVSVGLQLLVLPGVFLSVIFSLTIPLVIEKKLSPIKAMVISVQALRFQWFKLLTLYVILSIILALTLIPLFAFQQANLAFIGVVVFVFCLSYLAPMFYNVKGILYREIFGLTVQANDNISSNNDVFIA
ncbi:MAG: hypothetical protein COB35_10465 [Gammaproteobacteria bacterium]|nr:MAG: hypothetical protein COB35_10465 [Gammaproteobacteria bacterium]